MDNDEIIRVEIKGKEHQSIPLLSVAETFKELNYTIDKSYLVLSGKDKLSKSDRQLYKIVARDIRSGSVMADLVILISPLAQTALAFQSVASGLSVKDIWELTKNSFKFLKVIAELRNKGEKTTVIQHDNPLALSIVNQGGNVIINAGDNVSRNAMRTEQHIKNLAKNVDETNISSISALDYSNDGILLTPKENKLFNPSTFIDKNPIDIIGKIFRLDVESKTGRLRILEGIYQGEYPFQIIGNQQIAFYISALGVTSSKLIALKEIIKHTTGDETLAGVQLIDIVSDMGRLFE